MTNPYSYLGPEQLQNAVKLKDEVIGEKRELAGRRALRSGFSPSPTVESRDALRVEDYRKKSCIPIQQIRTRSKHFRWPGNRGDIAVIFYLENDAFTYLFAGGSHRD
jgi:hypothetical protein